MTACDYEILGIAEWTAGFGAAWGLQVLCHMVWAASTTLATAVVLGAHPPRPRHVGIALHRIRAITGRMCGRRPDLGVRPRRQKVIHYDGTAGIGALLNTGKAMQVDDDELGPLLETPPPYFVPRRRAKATLLRDTELPLVPVGDHILDERCGGRP